jgi:hypothetical protein
VTWGDGGDYVIWLLGLFIALFQGNPSFSGFLAHIQTETTHSGKKRHKVRYGFFLKRRDWFTMIYFDKFDNEYLNK